MWPRPQYVTGLNRDAFSEPFFTDRSAMRSHDTPTKDSVAAGLSHEEAQLDHTLRANFRISSISRSINASGG